MDGKRMQVLRLEKVGFKYISALQKSMKKILMLLFLISILISCTPKETINIDKPLEESTVTDSTPEHSQEKVRIKSDEVRIQNIQDMKVFNNELYFVTTDKYAGAILPSIYKYVDDKTPPIKVFETDWKQYKDRLTDLYSLEEYNGELYAGGPMGIFKLDKKENKFRESEFLYSFNYFKDYGVSITLIRALQGKLYGILNYKTILNPDDTYETAVTVLAFLEGNVWKLVATPKILTKGGLSSVEDLEEHQGELYVGYYLGGIAKLQKDSPTNEQYWLDIPTEEPYDLGRFTLLESYNRKLYACGESFKSNKGNTYSLESSTTPEVKANWKLELDYKDTCTFIKKVNEKLYVGADKWYDPSKTPQNVEAVKPLHVFDGKNWKPVSFVNAPGLSKGQVVLGVTSVEYFNDKLFIAVKTNYNREFEMQPSFYTLDDNGVLAPITWWKE